MSWNTVSSNTAVNDVGSRPATVDTLLSAYPFTVSGWGYMQGYVGAASPAIVQINPGSTSSNIRLGCSATGQALFRIGSGSTAATTTRILPLYTWGHFCGTATGSNSRYAFLNGQDKTQNVTSHSINYNNAQWGSGGSNGSHWNGFVAEVGIWDVELTDAEIGLLANGASPLRIRRENLKSYMPLRDNLWDYANNKQRYVTWGSTTGLIAVMFDHLDRVQHPDVEDLTSDRKMFMFNATSVGSGSFIPFLQGAL